MSSILYNIFVILFIVFFFGFCIFIHEFGHLLAAIWMGLHVDKFSIGMGKKLWGFRYKGIEYVISMLPIGGFVSIPQLEPTETPKSEDGQTLPVATPKARAIAAFAGPFFNILFGFVLAAVLWVTGVWKTPPATSCLVMDVPKVIPRYDKTDGLRAGERIVSLNGHEVQGLQLASGVYEGGLYDLCCFWDEFPAELSLPQDDGFVTMKAVDSEGTERELSYKVEMNPEYLSGLRRGDRIMAFNGKPFNKGLEGLMEEHAYNDASEAVLTIKREGQEPFDIVYVQKGNTRLEELKIPFFEARNPLTVGDVLEGTPAAAAGVKAGDQLLSYDDKPLMNVKAFLEYVKEHRGEELQLLVTRDQKDVVLKVLLPAGNEELTAEKLGIAFFVTVSAVFQDTPADAAGLQKFDRLYKLNGVEVTDNKSFSDAVKAMKGAPMTLEVIRDGEHVIIGGIEAKVKDINGKDIYLLGIQMDDKPAKIIMHPTPWVQFKEVFNKTARTLWLLFQPVTSFVTGHDSGSAPVKLKHMSSFVGISTMLWYTVKTEGVRGGLAFIILISFGLAFANLLPIPILDGGHIMFAAIAFVIRRRLPPKFESVVSNIFAGLLIALMLYITYNDILRVPKIKQAYDSDKPKLEFLSTKADAAVSPDAEMTGTEQNND